MTKAFADKINDWKTAIEAKIGSMIEEHANDSTAHSNLFSDKSKVTFTRALNNGTRIGTLTIDGTSTDIFCETDTNTTYNTATASANGLMSKEDKVKLNNIDLNKIQDGATYVSIDDDLNLYIGYDPITDILLTSDKSVIQSGQTATLTSTAKNGNALLEGVPISFYAGNDYLGSAVTKPNGIGTFSYTGTGAGNKQITAKCGSDVSQPYPLLDCTYIDADPITSSKTYNVDIGSSAFALEFDVLLSANSSQAYFGIGVDNNNRIFVGCIYNTQQGIRVISSGSETSHIYASTRATVGETVHIKFTYDNGAMTYNDGDETVTLTDTNVTPTKLLTSAIANTSTISNVRVYPI